MDCEPNCLTDMNSYTHFIKRTRRIVMEKQWTKSLRWQRQEDLFTRVPKSMVVLQTHGITVILV